MPLEGLVADVVAPVLEGSLQGRVVDGGGQGLR
jgi:hypothetical protein